MGELVSVILPTYNRADYLSRAAESVLSQDYEDLELIIVDDGSSDHTREVVEKIGDWRIQFMRTPVNRGVAAARNAGIRRAKGKYIAFQDSDDVWRPGKLKKQVELLENSPDEVGLAYHVMSRTDRKGKKWIVPEESVPYSARKGKLFKYLLAGSYIGMPTICMRSSVLKEIGLFDVRMPNFEDYELLLRISKKYKIEYVDEILTDTFAFSDGINGDIYNSIHSSCMIAQRYRGELKALGLYESKLDFLRKLGRMINESERVEEIIQKYCGSEEAK